MQAAEEKLLSDYYYEDFRMIGIRITYTEWKNKVETKLSTQNINISDEIKKYKIVLEKVQSHIGENFLAEWIKDLVSLIAIFLSTVCVAAEAIDNAKTLENLVAIIGIFCIFLLLYSGITKLHGNHRFYEAVFSKQNTIPCFILIDNDCVPFLQQESQKYIAICTQMENIILKKDNFFQQ